MYYSGVNFLDYFNTLFGQSGLNARSFNRFNSHKYHLRVLLLVSSDHPQSASATLWAGVVSSRKPGLTIIMDL